MSMGVTLRADSVPDVYVVDSGTGCTLEQLDKRIRALQAARRWLAEELRKQGEKKKEK